MHIYICHLVSIWMHIITWLVMEMSFLIHYVVVFGNIARCLGLFPTLYSDIGVVQVLSMKFVLYLVVTRDPARARPVTGPGTRDP